MRIALTGNPNSGKTTMYNALTGSNEKVGNWAGVTVDKKLRPVKKVYGTSLLAVDLPGAYSMSPFTSEEGITRAYIQNEKPDVIVNIVDATNLGRSLFFTTQLLEFGIPVVVALNKSDVNKKKQTVIDSEKLSALLGCAVVETVSTSAEGLKALMETVVSVADTSQTAPFHQTADLNDKASVRAADRQRFAFVNGIVKQVERRKISSKTRNFSDKIDRILTNKWFGIPFFALVMFLVFQISQVWVGPWFADGVTLPSGKFIPGLVPLLESLQGRVGELLVNADPLLNALLVDGIIGGVIAVVGFLPLVMVMYFFIAILEDCGYMSRVAVVLDPIFKRVGLSGKSVIPFVMSIGCAVPGIMASRTIHDPRERRAAAMLAPFMPCGAKIPIISLFAGAFFDNAGWVSTLMYFVGILVIFLGALMINGVTGNKAKKSFFIIELPEYKAPSLANAGKTMCAQAWHYIVRAATIILLCNTAVQVMQSFTWEFTLAESADSSILATIAKPFAFLLFPIVGVLSWQLAAAAITGFIAKENVVGTLAVCFVGLNNLIDAEEFALLEGTGDQVAGIIAITKIAALAYLMFNLFSPPCFAAIGAMNAEMGSRKWFWAGIGLQLGMGYTVAYFVYTIGTLLTAPQYLNTAGVLGGLALVVLFMAVLAGLTLRAKKSVKTPVLCK